MMMMMTMMTVG